MFTSSAYIFQCLYFYFQSFNGFLYLCPIIVFSLLYNIPKFFEVQTRCFVSIKTFNSSSNAQVIVILVPVCGWDAFCNLLFPVTVLALIWLFLVQKLALSGARTRQSESEILSKNKIITTINFK